MAVLGTKKSRSGVIVNGGSPHGAIAIIQSKFKIGLVSNAIEDSLSSFPLRTIPSKLEIQSDDNYSDTEDGTYFQNHSGDDPFTGLSPLLFLMVWDSSGERCSVYPRRASHATSKSVTGTYIERSSKIEDSHASIRRRFAGNLSSRSSTSALLERKVRIRSLASFGI